MNRQPRPVAAYDPRLVGLLLRGAASPQRIEAASAARLVDLQRTLWSLRKAIIAEGGPNADLARCASVGLRAASGRSTCGAPTHPTYHGPPVALVVQPADHRFADILEGLEPFDAQASNRGPAPEGAEPSLEDVLNSYQPPADGSGG